MSDPSFAVHEALLEKWRRTMDLVGPGPLTVHFEDSLAAVKWLEARGEWADLGSGAGFPGIALATVFPEARVTLVERRGKRCAFLEEVVAAMKLPNVVVRCADAASLEAGAWDGIISRAYLPPLAILELARGLLRPGGTVVLMLAREQPPIAEGFTMFHQERYLADGRERRAVGMRLTGG